MSTKDNNETTEPMFWSHHKNIEFESITQLLDWVKTRSSDMSHSVFEATIDCVKNNLPPVIVFSLLCDGLTSIVDIITSKNDVDAVIQTYVRLLTKNEEYETLNLVKNKIQEIGLEFPTIEVE